MNAKVRKVSVIGFGFSGLTAAWAFARQGYEVHVYEQESQIGGLLQTNQTEFGLVESAANAILRSKNVSLMGEDFNLEWAKRKKTAQKKWIQTDLPRRWPLSFIQTLKFLKPMTKLALGKHSVRPKPLETVKEWGQRIFHSPEFIDQLLGPALQGIYASTPDQLSASLCLNSLFETQKTSHLGSHAPKNGMSEFFKLGLLYLEKHNNFKLNLNQKISDFGPDISSFSEILNSDLVLDTRPDYKNVKYLNVFSVTLFFKHEDRPKFQGFGCLFAKPKNVLGVLFNSDIFEDRSKDLIFSETWIVSGPTMQSTKAEILNLVLKFRFETWGISSSPLYSSVTHWPQGIPHYSVEHESFLQHNFKFESKVNQTKVLKIANYTGQIGLNKILEKNFQISKSDETKNVK